MNVKRILITIGIILSFSFVLTAQDNVLINPNGGVVGNDGLKLVVSKTGGNITVFRYNTAQYCCGNKFALANLNNFNGGLELWFRFQRGTTYNTTAVRFTHCSNTEVTGAGTVADPYTMRMQGKVVSTISGKTFYVTVVVTYVKGQEYFLADYYVRAPLDLVQAEVVHSYLWQDEYIYTEGLGGTGSSDHGIGFVKNVGGTGINLVGSRSTYGSHYLKTNGKFDSYYTQNWSGRNYMQVNANNTLYNYINTTQLDNAIAVHWASPALTAGQTYGKRVLRGYAAPSIDNAYDGIAVGNPPTSGQTSQQVTVAFVNTTFSENEGSANHMANGIKIRVTNGVLADAQVLNFALGSGTTAVHGTDFTFQKGFIIPAGDYNANPREFDIPNFTILGNTTPQNDRAIKLMMEPDCNDLIVSTSTMTYTIIDDDKPFLEVIPLGTTTANETGQTSVSYKIQYEEGKTISLSTTVSLSFAGTASAADWVTAPSAHAIIAPNTNSITVTYQAKLDNILEGPETYTVTAASAIASGISMPIKSDKKSVSFTIVDGTPGDIIVEKVTPATGDASEPSTHGAFRIKFKDTNVTCPKRVEVTYSLTGALNGTDYTTTATVPAYIEPGNKHVDIPITVVNNFVVQGARVVNITIDGVSMLP